MKHTKIFFALAVLAAAVLAFGCKQPTKTVAEKPEVKAAVETSYNSFITSLEQLAKLGDVEGAALKTPFDAQNTALGSYGYKITDSKNGEKIAKDTKADDLKQRFKLERK